MFLRYIFIPFIISLTLIVGACTDDTGSDGPPPPDPLPSDIPSLIEMLREPQQTRSNEIMDALVEQGDAAIPLIFEALEDDPEFKEPAMFAVARFGADAVDDCITALGSQYMHVRYASVRALGIIGPDAAEAEDPLIDLFGRTMMSEQRIIMEALQKITNSTVAISMIKAALRVEDLRYDAMRTLGDWGPDAAMAIDSLASYLSHENDQTRWEAMDALEQIGVNEFAMAGMIDCLNNHPEPRIRKKAAETMGLIGPDAASGTDALASALTDVDGEVQEFAARALGQIAPESRAAIPALASALSSEFPKTRRESAIALGLFGSEASSALDALNALIANDDEQEYIKRAATEAVAQIEAG